MRLELWEIYFGEGWCFDIRAVFYICQEEIFFFGEITADGDGISALFMRYGDE